MKEFERARGIFKFALDKLPSNQSANLYNEYTLFEKMFGDKQGFFFYSTRVTVNTRYRGRCHDKEKSKVRD